MSSTFTSTGTGQKVRSDVDSNRNIPQYLDKFLELYKDITPLSVILKRLGKVKEVANNSFFHYEDDENPQFVTSTSASQANTITDIVLTSTHGRRIKARDILYNPLTAEQIQVTSVSSDTATCVRGHGSTTAAAIAANTDLQIMASSFADGSRSPDAFWSEPTRKLNYLQIAKEAVDTSGRDENGEVYGPAERARAKALAYRKFILTIEKSLLYGQLDTGASNYPTTGGLDYWLSYNKTDANNIFTEDVWRSWLKDVMRYNDGSNLLVLAGEYICDHIESWGLQRVQMSTSETVAGINVNRYKTAGTEFSLVRHGMLTQTFESHGEWAGTAFAINLNNFKLANYKGRAMKYQENIQDNDVDGTKGQWMTDFGAYVGAERTHGKIYNVPSFF
jgi:hypothetical protein